MTVPVAAAQPNLVRWYVVAYALPLLLLATLILTYLANPQFYLEYVLQHHNREYQLVELITSISALLGSLYTLRAAWFLWRRGQSLRHGALPIVIIALAAFFFFGEESSWGGTYLRLIFPKIYEQIDVETNLHNNISFVQTLGSIFIITMFFVWPGLWSQRSRLTLPGAEVSQPAIAEGPVIFCMAVAFLWKLFKSFYVTVLLTGVHEDDLFYIQFVDQINEHKEMLVAVSLLMYGLFRLHAVRKFLSTASNRNPRTDATDRITRARPL